MSQYLSDGFSVVSPSQVLTDMSPEDPEAADSLHRSPIDGAEGTLHNQLLRFADVEMDIVLPPIFVTHSHNAAIQTMGVNTSNRTANPLHTPIGFIWCVSFWHGY